MILYQAECYCLSSLGVVGIITWCPGPVRFQGELQHHHVVPGTIPIERVGEDGCPYIRNILHTGMTLPARADIRAELHDVS